MTKKILLATLAAAALAACGSDDEKKNDTCTNAFTQPAGTVPVNFSVDDTANQLFGAGELVWKGAMLYNSTTRVITADSTWAGPFATLYDDGPWNCGGHEPAGATAGDHKWGVTVFMAPPATGTTTVEYGLIDQYYETTYGNGWMWVGSNGSFAVAAGATNAITAQGLTIAAVGTVDLKLTLNKNNLDTTGTWSTATVKVKGSAWGWSEITLADDGTKGDATAGDGNYTMQLSNWAGSGKPYKHTGLLKSGATAEFIWVLNGVEYKLANGNAATTGVTAATKASTAASFTNATINILANKNSAITVP
jgi:hypothetical protein